jgi:hypothetical protein
MITATQNPSCAPSLNPEIPVSLFKSIFDTGSRGFHQDINEPVPWESLVELLEAYFSCGFLRKEDAPLFSPTIYNLIPRGKTNGFRCQENATTAGMAVIDADKGLTFDEAVGRLSEYEIEAVCYTTASNKSGDRFRIVVPFADAVEPPAQKRAVEAICEFLAPGWKPDTSKINCYSLFYVPGTYQGADNRFIHLEGSILPASAWLEIAGIDEPAVIDHQLPANSAAPSPRTLRSVDSNWNSVAECPYVKAGWIESYLGLTDGSYNALYTFMVKVALSATRRGVSLTAGQLANLAHDLERMSGRQHAKWDVATRALDEEAGHALAFAAGKPSERRTTANASEPVVELGKTCASSAPTGAAADSEDQRPDGLPPIAPLPEVRGYRFEDMAFAGRDGAEPNRAFQYLAQRCIAIGGDIWLRRGRYWHAHKKMFALPMLKQQYLTVRPTEGEPVIVAADIETFIRNAVPTLVGKGVFPGAPAFVLFDGLPYLNLWVDDRVRPNLDHIDQAEVILRLIHDVLCALPPASIEDMLSEIGDKNTKLRLGHPLDRVALHPPRTSRRHSAVAGRRTGVWQGNPGRDHQTVARPAIGRQSQPG